MADRWILVGRVSDVRPHERFVSVTVTIEAKSSGVVSYDYAIGSFGADDPYQPTFGDRVMMVFPDDAVGHRLVSVRDGCGECHGQGVVAKADSAMVTFCRSCRSTDPLSKAEGSEEG